MGGPFTSELIQFAAGTDKGKQFFFEKKEPVDSSGHCNAAPKRE
jgi:hypothetical protein